MKDPDANMWEIKAWPPYMSGVIVGFLQLPLMLSLEETLGGSSSLSVMCAQVLIGPLKKISPYIAKQRCGMANWWQVKQEN